MLGVVFALVAVLAGWAACRLAGVGLVLAPAAGLALLAVATSWGVAARLPLTPLAATVVVALGLAALRWRRQTWRLPCPVDWGAVGLVAMAAALPAALLGFAFGGLAVPVSNHDGAFHVETIDALRRGLAVDTWYPRGYHGVVAAVLGLAPWVDSARGTVEVSQGLAILAPLAVFGLAVAVHAPRRVAALAAVFQALSFTYPYDYQIWGGWPLGMGVLLTLGVWTAALLWIDRPNARLASMVGLLAGGILLTHGTEVYTASLGLIVIVALCAGRIEWRSLAGHLPLAVGLGLCLATPYLATLLAWERGGGALSAAATSLLDTAGSDPSFTGADLAAQIALGAVGAATYVDLPVRAALIAIGLRRAGARLAGSLWLAIVGVTVLLAYSTWPPIGWIFAVTFPWLADQRLLQVATVFASVLAAGGLVTCLSWLVSLRARLKPNRPHAARRLAVAGALLAACLAEASGVSIYKRLATASADESSFTRDDRAAMDWLKGQARPGDVLANDSWVDAGIWAPYTAGLPILLARSGGSQAAQRQAVLDNIADLGAAPSAEATACQLGVRYVYYGARLYGFDQHGLPALGVLDRSPDLQEVFRSGDAVVYETRLACT